MGPERVVVSPPAASLDQQSGETRGLRALPSQWLACCHFFGEEGVRATDVVQRHAPHFLLPFVDVSYCCCCCCYLLPPPTGSTRAVCVVHSSPPPVPPNVGQRSRKGRPQRATTSLGGPAGLSLPKTFERGRVEKMKRMIVLGAWP